MEGRPEIDAELTGDEDATWRMGRSATRQSAAKVYDKLLRLSDTQKLVITEWVESDRTERWKAAQAMRDAIEWRLKKEKVGRKVSVSVRRDGEVWLAWRIDKIPEEDEEK